MRLLAILLSLALPTVGLAGGPHGFVYDGINTVGKHSSGLQLHLDVNVKLSFDNTAAAPYVWMDGNGTNWAFTSTSVDGAGTDGDLLTYTYGTNFLAFVSIPTLTNGSAAAPAITFTSDTDTGLYRTAANTLGFSAGGGLRMKIDSNGIYGVPFYSDADGTSSAARFSFTGDTDLGLFRVGANTLGIAASAGVNFNGLLYNSGDQIDFGTACTDGHSYGTGDACVGGKFQVDGELDADSIVRLRAGARSYDGLLFGAAAANDFRVSYSTAQTPDSAIITVEDLSNALIMFEDDDFAQDWALPQQANPTLALQSADATKIGQGLLLNYSGFYARSSAADIAADPVTIKAGNPYTQAASNTAGAPLYASGGVGVGKITCVQATSDQTTLTFVVDGTSTTIIESTDWNCDTDDDTCCAALETYLDANISGFTATAVSDVVWLDPTYTTKGIVLTSANGAGAGTKFAVVDGAEGSVLVQSGSNAYPAIGHAADNDGSGTGFVFGSDIVKIIANGGVKQNWTATATALQGIDLNINGKRIHDSNGAANFGGLYNVTKGGVTQSIGIGKDAGGISAEFEGKTFFLDTLAMGAANSALILNETASATNPTFSPYGTTNTGLGGTSYGVTLISNATAVLKAEKYGFAGNDVQIDGGTFQNSTTDDDVLSVVATLNGTDAAGGSDIVSAINVNITTTDTTEWDEVNLMRLREDAADRFRVSMVGDVTAAGTIKTEVAVGDAPAEPHLCDAAHSGVIVTVDDTNNTAYDQPCVCLNLDGTGYDWRQLNDVVNTACVF